MSINTEAELQAFSAAQISTSREGSVVTIAVSGRFDYNCHERFGMAYQEALEVSEFRVDLSAVDYIDSSALGMLLLLRDHATKNEGVIRVVNASQVVSRILKVANFARVFPVD